jgi:hypothetical protein
MMPKRFIPAIDDNGRSRYVSVDCIDIVIPAKEGGYILKTNQGRVLGLAQVEHFCPDDYSDD